MCHRVVDCTAQNYHEYDTDRDFPTLFLVNIVLASEKFKENMCFMNKLLWFLIFSKIFNTHLLDFESNNLKIETTETRV